MAEPSSAVPTTRSWRPLRVMLVVTMVAFIIQFTLGEIVSAVATYPSTPGPINSMGDLFSAMSAAGGPILFVHAFFGLLLFVMILGTAAVAPRYHRRSVTRATLLAMLSALIALLGGYVWASSDFSNGIGILLMVNGALASYSLLFVALYYTR